MRDDRRLLRPLLLLLVLFPLAASADVLTLTGTYHKRNLEVQNPFAPNGVAFCTTEVRVNGDVTTDEVGSSEFSIDLSALGLKPNDPVEVKIFHREGCTPKVLNPEALWPASTFQVTKISVEVATSTLHWQTVKENGKLPFVVRQKLRAEYYHSDTVGKVDGIGTPGPHDYSLKVPLHPGVNIFYVAQTGCCGHNESEHVKVNVPEPPR